MNVVIILVLIAFLVGVLFAVGVMLPRAVRRYNEAVMDSVAWESLAKSYKARIDKMLDPSQSPEVSFQTINEELDRLRMEGLLNRRKNRGEK